MASPTIAILGGGKIGEALIAGLVAAGVTPTDIQVLNRRAERGTYLRRTYGVLSYLQVEAAIDGADIIFVCVKPKDVLSMVSSFEVNDVVVVSMAAGVSLHDIEQAQIAGTPVVRVMPNTPMLVGKGVCAVAPGRFVTQEQLELVHRLLGSVGTVVDIQESEMDAVTAMSGSSPAYLFMFVEAMIDSGVSLGLDRETARELVVGSFAGAAAMLQETDREPASLRADVSSPGGTTIAALRSFEESGLRGAVFRATEACAQRSSELA